MKEQYTLFKREPITYKLLTLAVLAAALFFVCRIVYAGLIALPYPKELQEASNVWLTETFLAGRSPYTLASLEAAWPPVNYDYPFLSSLLAAAIAKIICCTSVTAHFIISLTSILATGILGACFVARYTKTTVAPILAAILFMFCHWRYGYISAAPDDLGLLLMILTSYVAASEKVRNKPLWCAIGITLCFYTKQYFVFVAVGIFVYMLLYSRKDAFTLLAWSIAINVLVAGVITVFWPLYWTKAFLFTYVGTAIGGGGEISTFIYQMKYIIIMFAALFVIIVTSAAIAIRKLYRSNKRLQSIKVQENDIFALSAVSSILMIIPLLVLGRNDGAIFSYFLQLWMPYIVVVALVSFERMKPEQQKDPDGRYKNRMYMLIHSAIYAMIAVTTIYFGYGKLPLHILTKEEIVDWQKAYEYTKQYSTKGDIFYSRGLAYDGFARDNGDWMCGHEGEPDIDSEYKLAKWGITQDSYPYVHMIVEQNEKYREGISQKAADHEYALITLEADDGHTQLDEDYCIQAGYKCIDHLDLQFGNMLYEIVLYAVE